MDTLPAKIENRIQPATPGPVQAHGPNLSVVAGHGGGLARARRLVVLVPALDVDEAALARRVWELAAPAGLAVLFLGLCARRAYEPAMERRLITLASLTRDARIPLETRLEFGRDWLRWIRRVYRPGDVIICHAEQGTGRQPLNRRVGALGLPVWSLSGFYPSENTGWRSGPAELVFWAVSMAILAGFFWLQVRIMRLPGDWANTMLLYLTAVAETGLLWAWHHLAV